MLEQLRRNSRSFIIWVLFSIIIAAFILTFGTQGGLEAGCGGAQDDYVMTIDGRDVSLNSWRFGTNTLQSRSRGNRAQMVLDMLLVREILAQAAEDAGFRVSADLANEHILRGSFWVLGTPQDGQNLYLEKAFEGGDPDKPLWLLDYKRLEAVVQSWGLPTVDHFIIEQQRELMADLMRSTIVQSAVASPEEAGARFEHQNTTATVDAVVFRPLEYQREMALGDDELASYLASHDEEVSKKYKEDERLYKGVGAQVRVRQIMFKRQNPPASQAGDSEAPAEAPGTGEAAPPSTDTPDPGKLAAQNAHQELVAGADFGALAAKVSEDDRSKRKGGDLGWKSLKNPGLGAKELADALATLEVGAFSEVIETSRGYYILKVEDKREGDLTYDQVKHEIAEKLAGDYYAREAARRDAQTALDKAMAGKKLDELFERQKAPASPGFDPSQLPPELQQQITPEQLQELLRNMNEQGALTFESKDIPAESMWQGAESRPAADQPAPPQPAGGSAAATPGTAEPAPAEPAAGAEAIPQVEGIAPKVQSIGPFQRDAEGEITGLGKSKELMDVIFDQLADGQLAPKVYEVDGNFVVVQVVSRKNPDPAKFTEEEKARIMRSIAAERGYGLLRDWVETRCKALVNAGKVGINQSLLAQLSDDPKQPFRYQACTYIQ